MLPSPLASPACAPAPLATPPQHDTRTPRRHQRCGSRHTIARHARALTFLLLPPVVVFVALHVSCAYVLLCVCQVVLALGALELSWWFYRIRKRLLASLLFSDDEHLSRSEFRQLQFDAMHPTTRAVSLLADRICNGNLSVATLLVSIAIGGSVTAVVLSTKHSIVDTDISPIGWRVVVASSAIGATLSVLCGCMAPTARDAVVVLVYQSCFTVASLNSFLAHYNNLASDDSTMLDSLYVTLVGACVLVVWRVVTSVDVLATLLAIALDLFGVVLFMAPLVEVADFFERKGVAALDDKVAALWLVVGAAEVGHYVHKQLRLCFPRVSLKCHTALGTPQPITHQAIEDGAVALCSGAIGLATAWLVSPSHRFEVWELSVLLLAALLSQAGRCGIATMRDVALVDDDNDDASQAVAPRLWNSGVMVLVSPYLVAAIAFHPYIKSLVAAMARSTTTVAAVAAATVAAGSSSHVT